MLSWDVRRYVSLHLLLCCSAVDDEREMSMPADNRPHLSLMNYTWLVDDHLGGVLVMTTRRNTKKFAALQSNPAVAILVHDFGTLRSTAPAEQAQQGGEEGAGMPQAVGTCSITLYGDAVVVEGAAADRLRAAHLACNSRYPQFISGEGIAVLTVSPHMARICDVGDCVSTWASPGSARGKEAKSP